MCFFALCCRLNLAERQYRQPRSWSELCKELHKGGFYMNTQAVMLAAPYQRQVGKVTFEVTAYADAAANQTAEQMLLHLLERQIEKKGEPNA